MKKLLGTVAIVALAPGLASALGLDRSGQPVSLLFEDGNVAELSFGRVFPSVDGQDNFAVSAAGRPESGNVADNYSQVGFGVKYDVNPKVSVSVSFDQPYGSNVDYPVFDGSEGSILLGGTSATVDSRAVQALGRYKINDNFSVHGGLRYQEIQADVTLAGAAYLQRDPATGAVIGNGLNGYNARFDDDGDIGYLIGAAYERPEIALRVALTYFSGTTHRLPTIESINGFQVAPESVTEVEAPESVNLDFQTGIAADTLLFGSIRYAWYEDTKVSPFVFGNSDGSGTRSLTDIEDSYALNIGVGRRFNDKLSGSVSFGYEPKGDDLVSPLAPTNGLKSIALGLSYNVTEQFKVSGGIRYARLGDATSAPGGNGVADFDDNDVVAIGMKIGYSF
ncbi:outer membrane protein transport protein [Maribius pontilimi]|uniref:Outer membrane protein transport protein n=1 Tax=Palleronia pontilimi TaxID=1964209 RepID=A0A934ME28_9RHOB|nr:outer membrane protein transport protein [Palleronia pontilimi]MBJ3763006.1 outer membrane protein transport protein [Palleronia pontilimi]